MSSIKRIIFILAAIFLAALCSAAVIYSQEDPKSPQVILVVNRTVDGKILVVPQSQVYFSIIPEPETHPAPLSDGAYMICRQFTFYEDARAHVGFKCGGDTYRLQGIGIAPDKK